MYDSYSSTTSVDPATAGAIGAMLVVYWVAIMIYAVLAIIGLWKTFTKAGKPGWGALIPIYNTILILECAGKPIWWILLLFIPFVNIVILIIVMLDLAKAFGKSTVFAIFGLIIFSPIGFLMLGFGSAKYTKPAVA